MGVVHSQEETEMGGGGRLTVYHVTPLFASNNDQATPDDMGAFDGRLIYQKLSWPNDS